VVVDAASLERTAHGGVSGRIWLRDGDAEAQADFPEVGWSDLPLALLATWLPALERLARTVPARGEVECHFMDGPYYFTVRVEAPAVWRVRCLESRLEGDDTTGPEWRTDAGTFLASVTRAARAVLAHCDARGWWNDDTETLRRRLNM
jgi:hypothetical protein